MDAKEEPTQTTDKGSEIPVPKRSAWDKLLRRAAHRERATDGDAKVQNPNEAEFWDDKSPQP
jgi:hypothetical protein